MRIGFDARYIDDRYHGIGRYAFSLLEALTRLYTGDTFVPFYNPNRPSRHLPTDELFARSNVEPRDFPIDLYAPTEQIMLPRAIARARLDLWYTPYFSLPLLSGGPAVITIHDLIFDREKIYGQGRWVRYYYRPMMWLATRRARGIIAVSESTASDLRALYKLPRDSAKITVVPEAASPNFQPVTDEERQRKVRERYSLPESFIMALGVRRPHKNLGVLIEAYAKLKSLFEDEGRLDSLAHLVLVGETHTRYHDPAPELIERHGLASFVHSTGYAPDEDLPALYSLAEVFVLPSLYEGFGLPVLEAMGCGAPVVIADSTSLPEVAGEAALRFDPRDSGELARAIARLLDDPELRSRLREAGSERAAEFSWEAAARGTYAAFLRALSRPASDRP